MINLIPRTSASLIAVVLLSAIACKKMSGDVMPVAKDSTIVKSTAIIKPAIVQAIKTRNVIVIVVDGARYSETWGDSTHQYIPNLYALRSQGVLVTNFKNNGYTWTDPGHTAISTGNYENIDNGGSELPTYPSMFQSFLKKTGQPVEKAWVITSKEKLQILANSKMTDWQNKYVARTDCGPGYRSDDTTYTHTINVMKKYHPNLMLVNLKDPDFFGHAGYWKGYLNGIKTTDVQIKGIYDQIQNDPIYKDQTTIIVTNDHGRHLNGIADAFVSHGCDCDGCRHIEFFAIGPDFKKGATLNTAYEQIDISQTVAKLLNFKMEFSKGKVMTELFK
jgi:membrane-anchored protein YejM (alkaline phosphatase superfamily)